MISPFNTAGDMKFNMRGCFTRVIVVLLIIGRDDDCPGPAAAREEEGLKKRTLFSEKSI